MPDMCDCAEDGYCARYGREMRGRFRAICRGADVDLGTAAAFREQWRREASVQACAGDQPKVVTLRTDQAPGDAVSMTAAVYSLHRAHPGRYLTAVESPWPEVFHHNPDVFALTGVTGASVVQMHYPAIHRCNDRAVHFMQGWCEHLGAALGVDVPLLTNRPRLYFDPYDHELPPTENFWVICSGGKKDFTNKLWGGYQEVVDTLRGRVRFIQVGADADDHPRLRGAESMVGKTTLRRLFSLVRRARGVLCGVSLLMHVAAALERPAVVVAGGREPVAWNAYPRQQYLHTVGALPCCDTQGHVGEACWRSRAVPLWDGTEMDRDTCMFPVNGSPKCMTLVRPGWVAEAVLRYNSQ